MSWWWTDLPSLEYLSISNLGAVTRINIGNDTLETLNLDNLPSLINLYIYAPKLNNLVMNNLGAVETIYLDTTGLTSIPLNVLPALEVAYIFHNDNLTNVNFNGLSALREVEVQYNNSLTFLNFSGLKELEYINASHNQLTSINVTDTPKLRYLGVAFNRLASLDDIIGLDGRKDIVWFSPQSFDSVSDAITSGIFNDDPWPTIGLDDNTVITAADLQNIKALGKGIIIVLPNGIEISIDAASITDAAQTIDLGTMDIEWSGEEGTTRYGVSIPANSFIIIPPAFDGNYGFMITLAYQFWFSYDSASAGAGTTYNFVYINSSGAVTNYSANVTVDRGGPYDGFDWEYDEDKDEWIPIPIVYWENRVIVSFNHSSIYALWEIAPIATTTPPGGSPQTGDYRTLLLPGIMIALGLLGLGGWVFYNKRIKKATK
jgi:LPXTG-motif cell wall-anchored protein